MSEVQSVETRFDGQADDGRAVGNVPEPYLSVAEAARALRISPSTLRRYLQDYSTHIDFVRSRRGLSVAVSSIPALAQIRDLRARKLQRPEITTILASLPGEISLAGLADAPPIAPQNDSSTVASLKDLRTDINKMKRDTRDSEVVVRQSLANILFLVDKCSKEVQFHVSEERIASNERDLRIAHYEQEIRQRTDDNDRARGLRATIAMLFRRIRGAP